MTEKAEGQATCPRIKITPEAWVDLRLYVRLCPVEISGFGRVKREGEDLIITDLIIFPQSCRSDSQETSIDAEAQIAFLEALEKKGEDSEDYILWWHSHAWSKVSWSDKDERAINSFSYCDFWVSLVANKNNEHRLRVDFFKPERYCYDWVPLVLSRPITREEFKMLVQRRSVIITRNIQENVRIV